MRIFIEIQKSIALRKSNRLLISICLIFLFFQVLNAQRITTLAETYKQVYQGGGVSYGLYKDHVWSMSQANQDLFFELLFKDIKMKYVQYYAKLNPAEAPNEYAKVSTFMQRSLVHNSNLQLVFVLGDMPDDLQVTQNIDGKDKQVLNISDPQIYNKVADWMFAMMNDMYNRGTPIDMFSMANEPDWSSSYKLGYQDQKIGLGLLIQNAIPILKSYLADPLINNNNLPVPPIIAPASISPSGCLSYINNWKANYPNAWAEVDIVGTHQYTGGGANLNTLSSINAGLQGRGFLQTEQHTNKGDALGSLPLSKPHRGILSLTNLFSAAVNNGVESWFYFVTNYPQAYHDGGLMQVSWGGAPKPYKTYYAFKQLNSIQSDASHVMERTLTGVSNLEVVSYRKQGENKIVLHIANVNDTSQFVSFDAIGVSSTYGITGYKTWVTNVSSNSVLTNDETFTSKFREVDINLEPYALTSIELMVDPIGFDTVGTNQTINFDAITQKTLADSGFSISATASSGLPVTYSLVSGPATLSNNIVSLSGVGTVVLKASQKGNDTYLAAPDVYRTFTVAPEYPNIALGKTVTVSSIFSTTSSYTGDKLVDGDKTSNGSRWLSEKSAGYPQWAEIDLGGDYIVNSFAFWTGYNGYINPITEFNLEFWNGNVWETIHSETGNLNAEFLAQIPEIKTNKIRLNLLDAEKPEARIFEIELYGYELEAANVALGKAVVASSSNGAYIASNLVDGDNSTNSSRWLPLDASLPQWFTISLGEDHVLQGINFWTGFDGYKNPISDFNLEIWKDGAWESVFFETNNIRSSYLKMFSPLQTTQIRFNITGADSIKMFEFEVYGNAGTLSIDNVLLNNNIELYPNPLINNELFIKANMQIDNVDIYNLLGVKQNSQLRNNKVYVDNLSSGIYIIKINNNLTRKFVKL